MRICLIADIYPATNQCQPSSFYLTDLARALAQAGQAVTVVRSGGGALTEADINVQVVTAEASPKAGELKLVTAASPKACAYMVKQLNYWHCLKEALAERQFDVIETTQSLAAALIGAFVREVPAVVRLEDLPGAEDRSFDTEFQHLIGRYALSCVDAFSSPAAELSRRLGPQYAQRILLNDETSAAPLALRAMDIYKECRRNFAEVERPNLYRHGSARLLKSSEDMLLLYDKMLYDLLFTRSYRFRLQHWLRAFSANPRAFMKKAGARLGLPS